MSLKQFLVVGKSFIGLSGDKSPYELRKENLLPVFQPAARFVAAKRSGAELVQSDWLDQPEKPSESWPAPTVTTATANAEGGPRAISTQAQPAKKRRRNWLRILSLGLFGRRQSSSPLVQTELSLDRISVVRNDLADSDLELVIKKKKKAKAAPSETAQRVALDVTPQPWSRLTARLFEIGQEQ